MILQNNCKVCWEGRGGGGGVEVGRWGVGGEEGSRRRREGKRGAREGWERGVTGVC